MLQICWLPGLRPGRRWGSLQRSPKLPSWWGTRGLKNLTPAFGPPGLKLQPYTGVRLRPYGPRPTVPPHFKPWIRHGPQVTHSLATPLITVSLNQQCTIQICCSYSGKVQQCMNLLVYPSLNTVATFDFCLNGQLFIGIAIIIFSCCPTNSITALTKTWI